ncbi:MAG: hypothetical protein RMK89_06795 [Armatimonadota bacterium]|nr:hypothetical protein [Armatimonadota bacterium]MCX7778194.1 hypothetical protein [Armatimonadota bacterium]MDW8025692.1 hypothetical protein [Armatimonadota bacterium]MDW8143152.1 hypothetical protein [Armatimonadota bacterium]
MPRIRWSEEKILEEIRKLAQQGHSLNIASVRRVFSPLASIACSRKYFGSWRAAIEAAGFNYDEVVKVRRWTKERIVEEIKRLHAEGKDLRPGAVSKIAPRLVTAARDPRYFGSWRSAVEAAGINYDEMVKQMREREVDRIKQSIIEEIRRLYNEGKLNEISSAWRTHPQLFRRARHRFGSWQEAIEAAGLSYSDIVKRLRWTKERIIEEIKRLYNEGKDLRVSVIQKEYPSLLASAQSKRYFGSWRAAVEAAGIDYEGMVKGRRQKISKGAAPEPEQQEGG